MKKNVKIIISVLFTVIILVASLIHLDSMYNLRHYFDDWMSETDDDIFSIVYDAVYDQSGKELLRMGNVLGSILPDVFYCVKDARIYFGYRTRNPENGFINIWHIASVSLQGENWKEHYVGCLFDDKIMYPTYKDLSRNANKTVEYGGFYCDNHIFLHGNVKDVVFDLLTDTTEEVDSLPLSKYSWEIDNKQIVTIKDVENDTTHTLTLESMANSSIYAQKLIELSNRRIWSGESPTDKIFSYVKIVDNHIYIICTIYNYCGESFVVLFRYDFPSDKVYYISSNKVGGNASNWYQIAPNLGGNK